MMDILGFEQEKKRKGFSKSIEKSKLDKQNGKCYYCKKRFYEKAGFPQKHHKDGDRSNDKSSNLVLVCVLCHDKETHKQQVKKQEKKRVERDRREKDPLGLNGGPQVDWGF